MEAGEKKELRIYRSEVRVIDEWVNEEVTYLLQDNPTYKQEVLRWENADPEDVIVDQNKYAVYKNGKLIGKREDMKKARELYDKIYPNKTDEDMEFDKRLHFTEFFIEASSRERRGFWKDNDGYRKSKIEEDRERAFDWGDDSSGIGYRVGSIRSGTEELPVYINFSFAKLNGIQVCFYDSESRGCDWDLIETFIADHFPTVYDNGTRTAKTNSSNFHHAVVYCERKVVTLEEHLKQITILNVN